MQEKTYAVPGRTAIGFGGRILLREGWSGYTSCMDSVRFGRVLGVGTRLAAKTLVSAMDAATAPNPTAGKTAGTAAKAGVQNEATCETKAAAVGARVGQRAAQTTVQMKQASGGLKRGGKRFGEAIWGPLAKLSGVLWLEFTGVFFGIFALTTAGAAWKQRAELHVTATNHDAHMRFLLVCGVAVMFAYFFVSSFVKASRRGRGK
jgi:hypothetical protein